MPLVPRSVRATVSRQQEVLAANLAPSAAIRSRATQVYGIMQPGFAAQDDVVEALGLSLH